ncbi:MAG: hypothetical protein ABIW82_17240 [Dokdonella sp.]
MSNSTHEIMWGTTGAGMTRGADPFVSDSVNSKAALNAYVRFVLAITSELEAPEERIVQKTDPYSNFKE